MILYIGLSWYKEGVLLSRGEVSTFSSGHTAQLVGSDWVSVYFDHTKSQGIADQAMASTYTAAKAIESRLYPTAFAKRALFLLLLCLSCKLTQPVAREMVINNAFSLQTKLADRLLYIHNWSLLLCFTTKSFCHYYFRVYEVLQFHIFYRTQWIGGLFLSRCLIFFRQTLVKLVRVRVKWLPRMLLAYKPS